MASTAAAPPPDALEAGGTLAADAPELRSALAAAESAVDALAAACVSPCADMVLADSAGALLRRMGALSAALDGARAALAAQQPALSGTNGGDDVSKETNTFSSLPHSLVVCVLAALPADARLRCAEVCKAWLAAVCDRTLWLRADLSPEGGVTRPVTNKLLRAVSARAGGHTQALRLPLTHSVTENALVKVLKTNSTTLQELNVTLSAVTSPRSFVFMLVASLKRLLRAAPRLQVVDADFSASVRDGARALLNEPPFQPLRVHSANFFGWRTFDDDVALESEQEVPEAADMLALAAAINSHASLKILFLKRLPLDAPAVLDAFIDAALARRLSQLDMKRCCLSPACAPALARLLSGGTLKSLTIVGDGAPLLDAPAAALLADAMRTNTTLCELVLESVDLWHDALAGADVIHALTAHPSLEELYVNDNQPMTLEDAKIAGAALGTLVAADAPALQKLCLALCSLEDVGLEPLLHALRTNTHLRELYCGHNAMSDECARDTFLPAVRANKSLRVLAASNQWGGEEAGVALEEMLQAEALVKARTAADAAAAAAAAV
jgi:hypothetical protein